MELRWRGEKRKKREEERRVSLNNNGKGTAGQSEKREKECVGIEQLQKPSLVQRQALKVLTVSLEKGIYLYSS